ncbi:hypothetical protein H7142_00445 [Candidatus Saccharibacteria bacterium]|nr:hypothetical protein [Candidatus Saccharibacteria bacterium]
MTERIHDIQVSEVSTAEQTQVPMNWFAVQAAQLEGAKGMLMSVGTDIDALRLYGNDAEKKGNAHQLALCRLAIDAIKSASVSKRNDKYGADTDLYDYTLRGMAVRLLDNREGVAIAQAKTKTIE